MNKNKKTKMVLISSGQNDSYWLAILEEIISILHGSLEIVGEAGIQNMPWHDYDLVILDASALGDLLSIITLVRSQCSQARIVVFSPAPSWRQAREVMLVGAADFACKTLSKEYNLSTIQKNLARKAPSWQYQRKSQMEEYCDEEFIAISR